DQLLERILQDFQSVRQRPEHTTAKYKQSTDQYHSLKEFSVGDLVMVHLHKERFPTRVYHNYNPRSLVLIPSRSLSTCLITFLPMKLQPYPRALCKNMSLSGVMITQVSSMSLS
ncbi:hypothetical protein PanWU01x14_039860, partial [Parasponia andersonii]